MFGIDEKIEKLGAKLADAFSTRAEDYRTTAQDPSLGDGVKRNFLLTSAILSEIATIIRNTTQAS